LIANTIVGVLSEDIGKWAIKLHWILPCGSYVSR